MYSTLSYLTRKADFKQVNPQIPINRPAPESDPPEVFAGSSLRRLLVSYSDLISCSLVVTANQKELVADFLTKAKQLEYLISVLPKPILTGPGSIEDESDLEELQAELEMVNREYLEAVAVAGQSSRATSMPELIRGPMGRDAAWGADE